jgi:hypothetical protein
VGPQQSQPEVPSPGRLGRAAGQRRVKGGAAAIERERDAETHRFRRLSDFHDGVGGSGSGGGTGWRHAGGANRPGAAGGGAECTS